ncbi:MAG: hypothetical protein N3F07_00420 [Candidatus Micrarchaeota archaeon]|nr:hypothetical protein [Candidatus Micrarchaeota archaeon]
MDKEMGEKSLAFEMKGNRLKILIEDAPPYAIVAGRTYFAFELPSVVVGGKKYFVEGIF